MSTATICTLFTILSFCVCTHGSVFHFADSRNAGRRLARSLGLTGGLFTDMLCCICTHKKAPGCKDLMCRDPPTKTCKTKS
ncbi:hypothetical protein CHS0354_028618 [Potamilus streckersoni]|uniref:Uncharacterized protein n=1 Tax=Potamilus streckersoni TaxID=2493646 RepID=A0AAE0RUS3_9BIVA|nr:hypothetical protein CHS0354_028618 [Potamilus streckersoni]